MKGQLSEDTLFWKRLELSIDHSVEVEGIGEDIIYYDPDRGVVTCNN